MGVYDQIKKAFQDIVAPEIHELREKFRRVDQRSRRRWASGCQISGLTTRSIT